MIKERYAVTRKSDGCYLLFSGFGNVAATWERDYATLFEDKSEAEMVVSKINQYREDTDCIVEAVLSASDLPEIMGCKPGDLK